MDLLSQDGAYEIFTCLSAEFEGLVKASNVSHVGMFQFNSDIMEFLYHFNRARDVLVGEGFDMPELVEGLTVRLH